MKIYLVDVDNGETYEDYRHWIEAVFTTYRGASQYLIDEGYEPDYVRRRGEDELEFYWQESDEYMAECSHAYIIEKELMVG